MNSRPDRPQNSRSSYASYSMADQRSYGIMTGQRHMGPPTFNGIPQPVEVDLNRQTGPYPPWTAYPLGPLEDTNSPYPSNGSPVKTAQVSIDYSTRTALDPLQTWYVDNDGPWLPKGAVPETTHEEKFQSRSQPASFRNSGYAPQVAHHRTLDSSVNGNGHYAVPPSSDSGYGTRLDNASVRSYELVNSNLDTRGLTDRDVDTSIYGDHRSLREPMDSNLWVASHTGLELSPTVSGLYCPSCKKSVKTNSELKKHELRHTKPFHCTVKDCQRKEGYSTANDLERHVKSKHADLYPPSKTYSCLVDKCKSKDKAWPRLDNFRSHLKRIHKLSDDQLDHYVRRNHDEHQSRLGDPQDGQLDQTFGQTNDEEAVPSFSEEPSDPEASTEPDQWTTGKPMESGPPEDPLIDPSLENDHVTQAFVSSTEIYPIGVAQTRDLGRHEVHQALLQIQTQGVDESLKKGSEIPKPEKSVKTVSSVNVDVKSTIKLSNPEEVVGKGKTPKRANTTGANADVREAITAVLKAQLGRNSAISHSLQGSPGSLISASSDVTPVSDVVRPKDLQGPQDFNLPSIASHLEELDGPIPSPKEDSGILLTENLEAVLEAIRKAGYVLKKEPKPTGTTNGQLGASTTRKSENLVQCTLCIKFSGRPCELKKHMKRHMRPYGCTFPKCKKAFGSKNDWKRHENSQHFQSELWRCDEQGCSKVFHQVAAYKNHLTDNHKIDDAATIESKASVRRIGPNSQAHFWCGFCKNVVNLNQKGVDAWTERFNHIDDHFMGRQNREKQSILSWVHADGEDSEGVQVSPKPLEECSDESQSSSNSPSDSPPKSDSDSNESGSEKKKRALNTSDNEPEQRAQKRRRLRSEATMDCCECDNTYVTKLYSACIDCNHSWCERCRVGSRAKVDEERSN